jgi:hypothetical protein
MVDGETGAEITRPRRRFTPTDLSAMARAEVRKLVHALLQESGAEVSDYRRRADHDELHAELKVLWVRRLIRVRIMFRVVEPRDVLRFVESLEANGDVAGWLVAPLGTEDDLPVRGGVEVIAPDELIERFEHSSRVVWSEQRPRVAMDRLADQRALFEDARYVDPVGMRWLPVLAHNELPSELHDSGAPPQDWLERLTFRMLTNTFRFGGVRYGEAARGRRLPDALLRWPMAGESLAALLDCKASADGYKMSADHYLRFREYVNVCRNEAESTGHELRYMIVLSSSFKGSGRTHPFHARNRSLGRDTGLSLAYVRAIDLVRAAVSIERDEMAPTTREILPWAALFDQGVVDSQHFTALTESVVA